MATRPVDINGIKGRIAVALLESIFRQAGYKMTRFGRESDLSGMLKPGRDEKANDLSRPSLRSVCAGKFSPEARAGPILLTIRSETGIRRVCGCATIVQSGWDAHTVDLR